MLEILIVSQLVKKLAAMAKEKGRSGMWGALGALFWIVGEVLGFAIGFSMDMDMAAYGLALAGAAVGAGLAWLVVSQLDSEDAGYELADAAAQPNAHYDPSNPYSPPRGE